MSDSGLWVGAASHDENGRFEYGARGDQTGNEVGVTSYERSGLQGAMVLRCTDPSTAAAMSTYMLGACNNPNIGYSTSDRYGVQNSAAGIYSNTPVNTDCSALVSAVVSAALGHDIGTQTTSTLRKTLLNTGVFELVPAGGSIMVGDVLLKEGNHTGIVTSGQGSGRAGLPSELSGLFDGTVPNAASLFGLVGGIGSVSASGYVVRKFKPRISQVPKHVIVSPGTDQSIIDSYLAMGILVFYSEIEWYAYLATMGPDIWFTPASMAGNSPFPYPPLTNVAYVWGRFSEIMNEACKLHQGFASHMYKNEEDGYSRSMAATIGAVMCFRSKKEGGTGYVCIVEEVREDGITTSEVTEEGIWKLEHREKRYGSWDTEDYVFQGFIDHPATKAVGLDESAMETFIRIAEEHVGHGKSWACEKMGVQMNNGWSAAFVTACSAYAGSSLNIVIPNTTSCSSIGRIGVLRDMGTWINGPGQGGYAEPRPGDIVLFRRNRYSDKVSIYVADGAGIVTETNGDSITVVEGVNSANNVQQNSYSTRDRTISGYFRPNWEQIDGTTDSVIQYRTIKGLYTQGVKKEDAAAREIGYLSSSLKPSIVPSGIRLSAVNYTGLLHNMYSVFGAQASTSDAANAELIVDYWTNSVLSWYQDELLDEGSGLNKNMTPGYIGFLNYAAYGGMLSSKGVIGSGAHIDIEGLANVSVNMDANRLASFDILRGLGFTPAQAVGIMANIEAESHFNTAAVGDHGTSFGICQWHNNRGDSMMDYAGADGNSWATNLQGQLEYLRSELLGSESRAMQHIYIGGGDVATACEVADAFCRYFERPADPDGQSIHRQKYAKAIWEQLGLG